MNASARIVHVEPLPDWIEELIRGATDAVGLAVEFAGEAEGDELAEVLAGAHVIVTGKRRVGAVEIAAAGPELRAVVQVGRAPWAVDGAAAEAAGAAVHIVPHTGAIAVAEHAMALMLGVTRMLARGHAGVVDGDYRSMGREPIRTDERTIAFNWLKLDGVQQLYGKTLGLVGLGDIGLEVARRARAFDMRVLYTKRRPLEAEHEVLAGVEWASMKTLLAQSDVLSLHAPHTPRTEGLLDAAAFRRMKPTAILVNTARGGLVDEDALVAALESGRLAGAGLDVFVDEPLPADHPLVGLETVLLSPHLGGGTGGGQRGVANALAAALTRILGDASG